MELTIQNLFKTHANGVKALNGVNLRIGPGLFGLLGPNGAGKSTLMQILATLQEPDAGQVRLGHLDVLRQKDEVRKVLGYLPQEFGLYPNVTAQVLLDHFACLKGIAGRNQRREAVEQLLGQTNLYAQRHKKLGTYSGGMKRRFGIAVALLGNPRLVIVDEPTAGLDPGERNRFLDLLSEIGEHVIVMLSTHIVDDVTDLCGQVAIMGRGEVYVTGKPAEVIGSMQGKVWRTVTSKEALPGLRERHHVISTKLVGGKPVVRVYSESVLNGSFGPAEANLEDVYFYRVVNPPATGR
ncbi:MAG: ABC transporter ATP-binding protein [Cytophagales bacterium]|nr:ABC transporter ATP-binding protein [Cytophagales bacterium]